MPGLAKSLTGLIFAFCSAATPAADDAWVVAMNYPAWVVRNYETLPLLPGIVLQENDLLRTGKGGRLQLRLADGSVLQIGESSRLVMMSTASFQVLRGVFRVIPEFFDGASGGYRLEARIGAIGAAWRNSSLWGRADLERDAICLVEGELNVGSVGFEGVDMNQALSCYVKPRNQAPLPVDLIDIRQHQLWMDETELETASGIATRDGRWQLVLISLTNSKPAEQALTEFHQKGFAVQRISVVRNGRTLHRLVLPGFESKEAALNARVRIEELLGINDAWVWHAK
ncbi:MAG: SPOR domain-containing protein [Gammaproteobacteria bacterium]|nr:SPOR domain-containing protein [Gammaproteobacteria bacterium]